MPVPGVGVTTGPEYAEDLNSCLLIIDSHDHASGSGVPITPAGMDIESDLTFNNFNIVEPRSVRLYEQSAALALGTDLRCLYAVTDDLYFNDGAGNQIRITQSGGVAGTPGNIGSLVSPASATYVGASTKFVFQSNVNTAASLDGASLILRNLTVSSNALTLSPPNAMASNYALTLPALPASQKIMTLDAAGSMSAPYVVDNSTIEISTNTIQLKDAGVTQVKLAARPTGTSVGAGGVAISASSGAFSGNSVTAANVGSLSVTIVTTGRPVRVGIISDGTAGNARGALIASGTVGSAPNASFFILRGGVSISCASIGHSTADSQIFVPGSCCDLVDIVAAGTYTYSFQYINRGNTLVGVNYLCLYAYEL